MGNFIFDNTWSFFMGLWSYVRFMWVSHRWFAVTWCHKQSDIQHSNISLCFQRSIIASNPFTNFHSTIFTPPPTPSLPHAPIYQFSRPGTPMLSPSLRKFLVQSQFLDFNSTFLSPFLLLLYPQSPMSLQRYFEWSEICMFELFPEPIGPSC